MNAACSERIRPRIFYGWWVVFAAAIGQIHAYGAIIVFTFSLFIEALSAEFGWSRAQISLAFTLPSYTIIAVAPIVGRLIDHFGVSVVLLRSSIFLGILTASLYLLDGSLWHFYAVFFLLPILGAGTFPTSYSRAIINWFDRRRGLALGIGLVGTGVGAAILPPITSNVIALYGWREGFLFLGLLILLIGVPVIYFLLSNPWWRATPLSRKEHGGDPGYKCGSQRV